MARPSQKYEFERLGDAPLESHFKSLLRIITIFSSVVHVLEVIASLRSPDRMGAEDLQSFEFVYMLHFMLKELAITKEYSFTKKKRSTNCKCDETCWHGKETIAKDERW